MLLRIWRPFVHSFILYSFQPHLCSSPTTIPVCLSSHLAPNLLFAALAYLRLDQANILSPLSGFPHLVQFCRPRSSDDSEHSNPPSFLQQFAVRLHSHPRLPRPTLRRRKPERSCFFFLATSYCNHSNLSCSLIYDFFPPLLRFALQSSPNPLVSPSPSLPPVLLAGPVLGRGSG
jgi:hypothetical protein